MGRSDGTTVGEGVGIRVGQFIVAQVILTPDDGVPGTVVTGPEITEQVPVVS